METATFGERVPDVRSDTPSTSRPAPWRAAASLVAIIPAAGAALGAQSVFKAFREMAEAGLGGVRPVATAVNQANPFLIAAILAAAVIAGCLAVALVRKPARAAALPGLPFSILLPVLACAPAFLVWAAESYPLDFLANRVKVASVAEGSQHLENLLIGAIALALVVIVISLAAFARSRTVSRAVADVRTRAAVWAGAAILLLGLAVAFSMRYSYLVEAALRGRL